MIIAFYTQPVVLPFFVFHFHRTESIWKCICCLNDLNCYKILLIEDLRTSILDIEHIVCFVTWFIDCEVIFMILKIRFQMDGFKRYLQNKDILILRIKNLFSVLILALGIYKILFWKVCVKKETCSIKIQYTGTHSWIMKTICICICICCL